MTRLYCLRGNHYFVGPGKCQQHNPKQHRHRWVTLKFRAGVTETECADCGAVKS